MRGEINRDTLFRLFPNEARVAQQQAWHAELGLLDLPSRRDQQADSAGVGWTPALGTDWGAAVPGILDHRAIPHEEQ